jgi:hypothetical protein
MSSLKDRNYYTLGTILASAVADAGTTTIAYPTGTVQGDFDKGLATLTGCYFVLNGNDKIPYGTSGVRVGTITFGASNITITNNSGYSWAAGTKIDAFFDVKDGNRQCIPIWMPPLSTLTAADIVTDMKLGVDGVIEYAEFVTTIAVTTASKLATLGFTIDTVAVTGLTLGLTSATVTPKGTILPFALPTAANTLTRKSKLGFNASAVTAFVEGEGYVNLYVRHTVPDTY